MPKVNVYIPDELYERLKAYKLNISKAAQEGIEAAMKKEDEMKEWRVTYWPGTAQMDGRIVAALTLTGVGKEYLDSIAEHYILRASTYEEAQRMTLKHMAVSDGCLIEAVETQDKSAA